MFGKGSIIPLASCGVAGHIEAYTPTLHYIFDLKAAVWSHGQGLSRKGLLTKCSQQCATSPQQEGSLADLSDIKSLELDSTPADSVAAISGSLSILADNVICNVLDLPLDIEGKVKTSFNVNTTSLIMPSIPASIHMPLINI
ncbi:hypothetical protein NPX13_g1899 [Xylaria arbuscula]|uniref:Uncharacterized protein n=1 Tax=Xylaria arbuscula TaxID=114810 RepID=A0A9W8NLG4_9PEZI|nr:hypothetical protein NPX13_g1899 [Xylaria arbuscula]